VARIEVMRRFVKRRPVEVVVFADKAGTEVAVQLGRAQLAELAGRLTLRLAELDAEERAVRS
jgi:hypothetical protein